MKHILSTLRKCFRRRAQRHAKGNRGLDLGFLVADGQVTRTHVSIPQVRRAEHIAIVGKTGTGKSSLLRSLCAQDIAARRGFVYFDLHGDATPFLLRTIAREEQRSREDLSEKLILVEPGDPEYSVGLNILEQRSSTFVQIAEFVEVLKERWHLAYLGARSEELLRNVLYTLRESGYTLIELAPFLVNPDFRALCLAQLSNADVKQYFEARFNELSEAMQAVVREPILNKTSAFTADPHFRHILGQQKSTFSLADVMEEGRWLILNLDRGRLGEEAVTLGSLFLSMIKHTLFSRHNRQLFTLYCDEIQNLVVGESSLETILSESRKFGVSVTSANQFLDQFPPRMRSAILAVGTHIFFQLSSGDAQHISAALDGGKSLAELLKNLPHRQMVVKSGAEHWQEVRQGQLEHRAASYANLLTRCRARWARRRNDIEEEIVRRHARFMHSSNEILHGWD